MTITTGGEAAHQFTGLTMKFKLLHVQIAAAALLAPVAMSMANTEPKAPRAAKPAISAPTAEAAPAPAASAPRTAQSSEAATASGSCGPKVRVVYAGYVQPAAKDC